MSDDLLDEFYCSDCGNPADNELCDRCKSETIDWNKTDRRWNGKPFWQETTQATVYIIPNA